MSDRVFLCEMAPRDGMQILNRSARIPFEMRADLLRLLQRASFPYIEAGSFVNATIFPQLADTPELLKAARLPEYTGRFAVLVPNLKYFQKHRGDGGFNTVAVFLSASEYYSQRNKRISIADDLADAKEVAAAAKQDGHHLRAHLSGAFRDLTETNGPSDPSLVADMCSQLIAAGCETVALADTDGRATPADLQRVIGQVAATIGLEKIGVHLHDRDGGAMANVEQAVRIGVRTFDSSVGGIGGTKAIDAPGNVATEDLVRFFDQIGVETGIDKTHLARATELVKQMSQLA